MAARGSIAKEEVVKQILMAFPKAFKYDKEIRLPMIENGEELQIKVTLTAAKNMVSAGGDTATPGTSMGVAAPPSKSIMTTAQVNVPIKPTEQEKQNVSNLLSMLGL